MRCTIGRDTIRFRSAALAALKNVRPTHLLDKTLTKR